VNAGQNKAQEALSAASRTFHRLDKLFISDAVDVPESEHRRASNHLLADAFAHPAIEGRALISCSGHR
jgi:hypothetical protein